MKFITASDFVGEFQVGRSANIDNELNNFIDNHEDELMVNLLGVDLYNVLLNDIGGSMPIFITDPLLRFMFEKFMVSNPCGCCGSEDLVSNGVVYYLKGIIYFKWMQKTQVRPLISGGLGKQSTSNNETQWDAPSQAYSIYNSSIKTGQAIQKYCLSKRNDYPSFRANILLLNNVF